MTVAELLAKYGIRLANTAPGDYATTCPQCSHKRKPENRNKKCLGVHIDAKGACWRCNHCDWSGPEKGDGGDDFEATYDYHEADGAFSFQKVRNRSSASNRFLCRRREAGIWVWGLKGIKVKPLYRLPEIIKAIAVGRIVLLVEGEKDADNCWRIGLAATCNFDGTTDVIKQPKAKPKWRTEYSEMLRGADVVVLNDHDPPGYAHADTAARMLVGVAKRVRRLDLAPHWPEIPKGGDVSDWLAAGHTGEELAALIEGAPDYMPQAQAAGQADAQQATSGTNGDDDAELERLAKLSALDYEHARKDAAEKLGVRASILDRLVKAKRSDLGLDGGDAGQGKPIEFPEVEPWPEPVDGVDLLDDLAKAIRAHVLMSDASGDTCALWVPHSYLIRHFAVSPKLSIRSPVRECGKSTLIEVLSYLVYRALKTDSISKAALFRVIESHHPTLLIDEVDTFVSDDRELKGLLNASHRHDGAVLRTVGESFEPRRFGVYAATALSGIGGLADTLAARSLPIDLKRRLPGEKIKQLRVGRAGHLTDLRRRVARWAADNRERIAAYEPTLPEGIHNRQADNWFMLLAIAEVAGGDWPERARKAATTLSVGSDEVSQLELLLRDIRDVFDTNGTKVRDKVGNEQVEIGSADLVEALLAIESSPWKEMGRAAKPLTQNKLARMLKPLRPSITPENVGPKDARVRGYIRAQFEDAFERYLGSEGDSQLHTRPQPYEMGTSDDLQLHTAAPLVGGCEMQETQQRRACGQVCTLKEGNEGKTQFRVLEDCPPETRCLSCGRADGTVKRIKPVGQPGAKSETLHIEDCAAAWFCKPSPSGPACQNGPGVEPETASVPFMLTDEMRRRLRVCGYSDQDINTLTPQRAWEILAAQGWQP